MAVVTITRYSCPNCKRQINLKRSQESGALGTPLFTCPGCSQELVLPCLEWEMMFEDARNQRIKAIEPSVKDTADAGTGCLFGGCGAVLTIALIWGIAFAFGASDLINHPLFKTSIMAGAAVAIGIYVGYPWLEKRQKVKVQLKSAEALLADIEASRRRMNDPAYREKLRSKGISVRSPLDTFEPLEIAASVERVKAHVQALSALR